MFRVHPFSCAAQLKPPDPVDTMVAICCAGNGSRQAMFLNNFVAMAYSPAGGPIAIGRSWRWR
jgi:hypothetical protein